MKFAYRIAGFFAVAAFSANASAQGFMAGVAIGTATQQGYDIGGPAESVDDSDDSIRIFGGYMISPMQGVVVSFIDLGVASYAGSAFGGFTDHLDAEGYDISYVVGWAPGMQTRFSIFGTVGVFGWDQDVLYTDATGRYPYQDDGTSFSFGLGTEFKLSDSFGIHLEYQLFKDVGDERNSGHELDREVISVGVDYRFKWQSTRPD